jgi:RNA polymerase sigma factor (sigma-70 family)
MDKEFLIETTNYDGTVTKVGVNMEVYEFNTQDHWKQDWQDRKQKHELSLDDLGQVVGGRHIHDNGLIFKSAEEEIMKKFESEEVKKSLGKLSEKQRRRIKLKFFENLTFEEIAKIENISLDSTKESIKYALKNLMKILEKCVF